MEPFLVLFKPNHLENIKRGCGFISRDLARLRGMADFALRPQLCPSVSPITDTTVMVAKTSESLLDHVSSIGSLFLDSQQHGFPSTSAKAINVSLASASFGPLTDRVFALGDFALLLKSSKHVPQPQSVSDILSMLIEEIEFHFDGFHQVLFPSSFTPLTAHCVILDFPARH